MTNLSNKMGFDTPELINQIWEYLGWKRGNNIRTYFRNRLFFRFSHQIEDQIKQKLQEDSIT